VSTDDQRTKWRENIAENFNRLSWAHEHYRQMTGDRQTDGRRHSKREREFSFACRRCTTLYLFITHGVYMKIKNIYHSLAMMADRCGWSQ